MAQVPTTNPSNSYGFFPAVMDFCLEGFERSGIRPSSLTQQQLVSAYRSINFALSTWTNRSGPNLWARDLQTIQLTSGQSTYNLLTNTIQLLDVYLRQYPMSGAVSLTLNISTVINTPTVTVGWPAHGLIVGDYINFVVPVSVGGLILLGFYTVSNVPNGNTIQFKAPSNATSTDSPGKVPQFTSVGNSATITVTFPNHGQTAGSSFNVQVQTTVSDVVIYGSFIVNTVIDANNFTITGPNPAFTGATVHENNNEAFLAGQNNADQPVDRILYPLSETDYASLTNKYQEGLPTSYWFNRLSPTPTVTLWLVPNQAQGPYALQFYRTRQLQDANLGMGQTPDVPYQAFEALCSDVAARLAQKFAPDKWPMLRQEAAMQWQEFSEANYEKTSLYIAPDLTLYYDS